MDDIMQNPEAHNSEIKDNIVDYNILQGKAEDCSYVDTQRLSVTNVISTMSESLLSEYICCACKRVVLDPV